MSNNPIVNMIDAIDACVNYCDTHGNNWKGTLLSEEDLYNSINAILNKMGIQGLQASGFSTALRYSNRGSK